MAYSSNKPEELVSVADFENTLAITEVVGCARHQDDISCSHRETKIKQVRLTKKNWIRDNITHAASEPDRAQCVLFHWYQAHYPARYPLLSVLPLSYRPPHKSLPRSP